MKCKFEYTVKYLGWGSKAPTEYQGSSKELTERAWLQLVKSCALHTHCCPNFWKGEGDRMRMFRGILQGQEWSSKEFQDKLRQEGVGITLYIIFKLENTSGDS